MIAETAYNVIQSLSKEELQRLFALLHVIPVNPIEKQKNKSQKLPESWQVENLTEMLKMTHFNKRKSVK